MFLVRLVLMGLVLAALLLGGTQLAYFIANKCTEDGDVVSAAFLCGLGLSFITIGIASCLF